jgi:hypothetical protein
MSKGYTPTYYTVKRGRMQVLTAASMKMAVFWVVAPCGLVEVYRRFTGACCLHPLDDEPCQIPQAPLKRR